MLAMRMFLPLHAGFISSHIWTLLFRNRLTGYKLAPACFPMISSPKEPMSPPPPHPPTHHTHPPHTHTHTQPFLLLSLSVYPSSLVPFPHSVKHLALAFFSHILTLTHFLSLVLL